MSWKKSDLVRSKILGLFVNTLTAEYTYSRRNMQTLTQQVQTQFSLKQKTFSGFFIAFLKSTLKNIFKKKEKKSALVRSKILGLFINTLTAEYTYSRRNMQTFRQHIQTPLSLKQKTFSGYFIAFLKST